MGTYQYDWGEDPASSGAEPDAAREEDGRGDERPVGGGLDGAGRHVSSLFLSATTTTRQVSLSNRNETRLLTPLFFPLSHCRRSCPLPNYAFANKHKTDVRKRRILRHDGDSLIRKYFEANPKVISVWFGLVFD